MNRIPKRPLGSTIRCEQEVPEVVGESPKFGGFWAALMVAVAFFIVWRMGLSSPSVVVNNWS